MTDRERLRARDAADPVLRREQFDLAEDLVYLDGNSLGPPVRGAADRVAATMRTWRDQHVSAWNDAGWVDLVDEVSRRLAPLLGARPSEVTITDSTSVNLFQALVTACRLRPDRPTIVIEDGGFPTDSYVAHSVAELLGRSIRRAPRERLAAAITDDVAVVTAAHVDYRSGHRLDARAVGVAAHEVGALVVWDLAHTTGALHVDLPGWQADLAVGCTYKFLNGGPGAPGYLWAADGLDVPATIGGWWGHARPFAFAEVWEPASGAARFRNGSPPILGLQPLVGALDVLGHVRGEDLQTRAEELTGLFIDLVDEHLRDAVEVASPRPASDRGAQVSLRHEHAFPVMQALIDRGVIGDHRPPNLLRFGFAPLHTRWVDVHDAVTTLHDVLTTSAWQSADYTAPHKVP